MIRAVIDTNVLVSGLLKPAGNEALVLLATQQAFNHPCFSDAILAEYIAVLNRPKFSFPPEDVAAILTTFRNVGELFVPQGQPPFSADPADAKFIHCAEAGQAEYLVTGNKRHFPQDVFGPTRIVSAGELLDRITLEI